MCVVLDLRFFNGAQTRTTIMARLAAFGFDMTLSTLPTLQFLSLLPQLLGHSTPLLPSSLSPTYEEHPHNTRLPAYPSVLPPLLTRNGCKDLRLARRSVSLGDESNINRVEYHYSLHPPAKALCFRERLLPFPSIVRPCQNDG